MARGKHIDHILKDWDFDPGTVSVRECQGSDGRPILQMRIDMGLLQLEREGRPDGSQPHGMETFFDYLISRAAAEGEEFSLDEEQCVQVDREFVQFYHRRVCWLKLEQYTGAKEDADDTLGLMDFCLQHSPDENWTMSHEQYRPFVLFHRVQASALAALDEDGPEEAFQEINAGLDRMEQLFRDHEAEEQFEDDELVKRLIRLRESLRQEYDVGQTLQERLDEAVASEQYELAAKLRDEMARRRIDD